jgi:hypothetical protein
MFAAVHESVVGTSLPFADARATFAIAGNPDIRLTVPKVRHLLHLGLGATSDLSPPCALKRTSRIALPQPANRRAGD